MPDEPIAATYALALAHHQAGRLEPAEAGYRAVVALQPGHSLALGNLGGLLCMRHCYTDAIIFLEKSLAIEPDSVSVRNNIANAFRILGRAQESAVHYQHAANIQPEDADTQFRLGVALRAAESHIQALVAFGHAVRLRPDYINAHIHLGNTQQALGLMSQAETSFRQVLRIAPDHELAHSNLGNVLSELGKCDDALVNFRRALDIKPTYATAFSNLLFALNYAEQSAAFCLAEARRFGDLVTRLAKPYASWSNPPMPGRCLRIGLVSGDLRRHPVGHFLESVVAALAANKAGRLALYAYPTHSQTDEVTERIKPSFSAWKPLLGLTDEAAARLIHDDGIDILIDLSGHTAHNRLPVFAWRPAPVQVSWLGYWATTGVAQIDYLIADPWVLPESEEKHFTEKIWRMPETRLCFTAPDTDIAVSALPALTRGEITFGCFNTLVKMNDTVVALWARVLKAVPGSRLFLKAKQLQDASVKQSVIERFAAQGIDTARLILEGPSLRADYLAAYHRVDIGLDPFPFAGGTTTAESLWMGVPVVSLAGERLVSRQGLGLLMNAGLPEWVATDADDYVAKAVLHASDLKVLAKLRKGLRKQVLASPLFDAPRFAQHFEAALRGMWDAQTSKTVVPSGHEISSTHSAATTENVTSSDFVVMDSSSRIASAIALHQQGHLDQAALAYKELLRTSPDSHVVLQLLATIAAQQGRPSDAIELFNQALKIKPDYADALANLGNALCDLERFEEAIESYDRALEIQPRFVIAWCNRGNALRQLKRHQDAIDSYGRTLKISPDNTEALFGRGSAMEALLRYEEALESYNRMLKITPNNSAALNARGSVLVALKRPQEALQSYDVALKLRPDYATALVNRGITLYVLERLDEALRDYDHALELKPNYAEALVNRGNVLLKLKRMNEALESYDAAVRSRPGYAEALSNRGDTLVEMGRHEDALESYQQALGHRPAYAEALNNRGNVLVEMKQYEQALRSFDEAIACRPDYAEALSNRGNTLAALKRYGEALASFQQAITVNPNYAQAHFNCGVTLVTMGSFERALDSYHQALAVAPDYVQAHNNIGEIYRDIGQLERALLSYTRALEVKPDYLAAHDNLLFAMSYSERPEAFCLAEAKRYGDLVTRLAKPYASWSNPPMPGRCLRIGLVSGDLRRHPVGHFLESVVAALAADAAGRLALYAYPTDSQTDEVTERIKLSCRAWHSAQGLSDEAFARRIHDDGIDILIDLSGHTAHNRLPVFAWKPAPVQVSWLGYWATTGVAEIDYLIADPWVLPESEEKNFTEKIWRMLETRLCFTAPDTDIAVSALPALARGEITFGCFNTLVKMNDAVVALWARVLKAVPGSRLFLKAKQLQDASVKQSVLERFAAQGIDTARLILEGPSLRADYLAAYHRVDIGLDPFPFAGGTTTAESLWMGVPVLSLAGERLVSRQGLGLLMNAGLPEWVATDADDYVAKAVLHASNLKALAKLRKGLRKQVLASPLFDAPRFAQHFEAALRGMWAQWCGVPATVTRLTDRRDAVEKVSTEAERHDTVATQPSAINRHADVVIRASSLVDAVAHNNQGLVLQETGQLDRALESYRAALVLRPGYAEAYNNMGNTLRALGRHDEALSSFRHALELRPDYAIFYNNIGTALHELGRLNESAASYRRALEIDPDFALALSNVLLQNHYLATPSSVEALREAQSYGDLVTRMAQPYARWSNAPLPGRCLRVGLVSGDLSQHPVSYFLESVLRALGASASGRLALYAYPTHSRPDELTLRIKPMFAAWKPLPGLTDEAAARLIHDDGIDILIDLSGHTAHNRLPVFAWKPAPVQVSWLGYWATTGVAQIDYLIADPWVLPESEEKNFTEKIWRLPETRMCFTAPDVDIAVSALPARESGEVTFGCFNTLVKMNDAVIALWARVLKAVPGSQLFLKAKQLQDASVKQSVLERFAAQGIDAVRLILEGPSLRADYFAAYHRVDIGLDPFPFAGGTTTAESLWMGVPVVSLAGERLVSRQGLGLLMNAGLPEWVATDADDYVAKAVLHASDLKALAKLRKSLRKKVLASPLFDASRFAQHFEAALRGMWQQWCGVPATVMRLTDRRDVVEQVATEAEGHDTVTAQPIATPVAQSLPPHEQQRLNELIGTNRHADVEICARQLVASYPNAGFAWRVLATSLQVQGKDALFAWQNAAALLPGDAMVHYKRGTALKDAGQLEDAEASYRKALQLKPDDVAVRLSLGNTLKQLGKLNKAVAYFRYLLAIKPDWAEVHYNLANTLKDLGQIDKALASYQRAIEIKPKYAEAHTNLGLALKDCGQFEAAAGSLRAALAVAPANAQTHAILGAVLRALGDFNAAIASCRQALALEPSFASAHLGLGNALMDSGQLNDAELSYRTALEMQPDLMDASITLGNLLCSLGRLDDAAAVYRRALVINPLHVEAHYNLGCVLKDLERYDDAVGSFRNALKLQPEFPGAYNNLGNALREMGDLNGAVENFRHALRQKDDFAEAHNNLGNALKDLARFDEAEVSLRRAIKINPEFSLAHSNLGVLLHRRGRLEAAVASFGQALAINPTNSEAHNNLGNVFTDLGRLDAAVGSFRHALEIQADSTKVHSNLLFASHYLTALLPVEDLREARRYGDLVTRLAKPYTSWSNASLPGRCLRIGLVSGDLRRHPVGHFLESVVAALAANAAGRLDLYAYPTQIQTDEVTERLKLSCQAWHSALGLSDQAFARRIHDDGIDILIDLSGHTAHNRLPVFAWKPAPVQVSWLGYWATTGVAQIDYLIADPWVLPESEEKNFTEKIWRLPETRMCFTAPDADVAVSALPALATPNISFGRFNTSKEPLNKSKVSSFRRRPESSNPTESASCNATGPRPSPGRRLNQRFPKELTNADPYQFVASGEITFGCFNTLVKMNDTVVALWARVLKAVPGSHLFLKAKQLQEASVKQSVIERFAAQGIDATRLILEGPSPRADYFAAYHRVDIGLDPFPFAGGTTTAESLWMGVPVLSLAGERLVSRQGLGLLMNAGLPEWVATDGDDYVAKAVLHASNLKALAKLRKGLRKQVLASPLFDAPRFAQHFEAALRGMWTQWCEAQIAADTVTKRQLLQRLPADERKRLLALFNAGRHAELEDLAAVLALSYPSCGFLWKVLGASLELQGKPALPTLQKAAEFAPNDVEAHFNLGVGLAAAGQTDAAIARYLLALEVKPDYANAHCNLGNAYTAIGQIDRAVTHFRQALLINPDFTEARSKLLFVLNYTDHSAKACFAEALHYGEMVTKNRGKCYSTWQGHGSPQRLKVGFVSGDLREHPVAHFLESVLSAVNPDRLELIAYSTFGKADEVTARIKPLFAQWRSLLGLDDQAAAQLIHSDGVHILIDLAGHTAHNRLSMFAWKPAPVQVSWLGYFATTGVAQMDYLIADPWTIPKAQEKYFTETVWRLPDTRLCFSPPPFDLSVSPLPALENGQITFASFNKLAKMNDSVVAVWAQVLREVPHSRLFLKAKQLKEPAVIESVRARFGAHGINSNRLVLEGAESRKGYLAAFRRVDIALDPFPYPGGTTTVESLWMGVPVLTLQGEHFLSRQGLGLLENAGLPAWIASSTSDYVARAKTHAADLQALAAIRELLRSQVLASPLFDAPQFTHHFETALRGMWDQHAHQRKKPVRTRANPRQS